MACGQMADHSTGELDGPGVAGDARSPGVHPPETALADGDPLIGKGDLRPLLILLAVCAFLFFFRLGDRPLWDVDEGMHAATSKDMVLTGDWITPRVNGVPFFDKPALFNWLVALSFSALGYTEFAARLPAAVLGLATVLVTYMIGKRFFGSRAGLMGGVVLATAPEMVVLSRIVVHDIALAFFITLALHFFYSGFRSPHRRRTHLLMSYAAAGFAVLAKGPIGMLLPAGIIGLFLLARGRLDFLKEMSLGWGTLVFLLISAPWYVLISLRNPGYASDFFLRNNFLNFLSKAKARHPRPFHYYFMVLLGGMFPWSFFIPVSLLRPLARGLRKADAGAVFLTAWFLVIFLFFSVASSKLGSYILPALPAVALLVGKFWHDLATSPDPCLRRGAAVSFGPLPAILLAITLYVVLVHPPVPLKMKMYGVNLSHLNLVLMLLGGILTTGFLLLLSGRAVAAFGSLAATVPVVLLTFILVLAPLMNPYQSTKGLALEMDRILPPGKRLLFYRKLWDSALFYTDRRADVLRDEGELMARIPPDRRILCVMERGDYQRMEPRLARSRILEEEGQKVLVSIGPGPESDRGRER
jgi:4-amino-4-deoxy-L-arabinose transferase-like glycosyltransferase